MSKKKTKVLSKFTILCWATFIAILGRMWPMGCRLDTLEKLMLTDIKGSIQQVYNSCKRVYVQSRSTYIYKANINGCKGGNSKTMVVGENTPLISMERLSREEINKEIVALNDTLDQMDLIDIFRTFHPKAAQYTMRSVWKKSSHC